MHSLGKEEAPGFRPSFPSLPFAALSLWSGMSSNFAVSAEALREIVTDAEEGKKRLAELGGVRALSTQLNSDLTRGIRTDPKSLASRRAHFSINELPPAKEVTFLDMVVESLEDRMVQILMVSAVISLVLGLTVPNQATGLVDYAHGWVEGAAILLSVALVTLVSSVNNYQKEQKFKELSRATPPMKVHVIRDGRTMEITDKELLTGDVMNLTAGDVLTVDALVLRSTSLKVDESAATGENDDVLKSAHGDAILRSGSNIVEGEGTALVMGVGIHSFSGHIAMQVREAKEETPLQEKLSELADVIGQFGMIAASIMFVLLSGKELLDTVVYRKHPFNYKKYLDNLTTAVTIVVVAVPEGLPLSVTIALAYSMKQMFRENNLVRHLVACETMGGATTICTDKTGTITQNDMTVTDGVTSFGAVYSVPRITGGGASPREETQCAEGENIFSAFANRPSLQEVLKLFLECIAMNTKSSRIRVEGANDSKEASVRLNGSKTEQALINFVYRVGEDPMQIRAERLMRLQQEMVDTPSSPFMLVPWPSATGQPLTDAAAFSDTTSRTNIDVAAATFTKELRIYPFTSARKRMTTALVSHSEGKVRYYVKGASELVLEECQYTYNDSGERVELTHELRQMLEEGIMSMARRQLRTLALAYTDLPPSSPVSAVAGQTFAGGPSLFKEDDEGLPGLTLLGIVGIRDPVRPEVPNAIAACRRAGVTVRMITGDNKGTAISIAKEVGIYGPVWSGPSRGEQGLALEGPQFREFAKSARQLNQILPRLQVISRASPLDKRILVAALMERGEVVAVTGDGTNDAPALKGAHVGFAMNSGTEVAKTASDVVILDDNFSTIVTAMRWGRNVNDNISKFLQFQMTVNVAAVVVSFLGALLDGNGESPLKPVQLLWLNLIMDTLAALALATETPSNDVLLRSPKPKNAALISRRMWLNIVGQSLYQVIVQLWLIHFGYAFFNVEQDSDEHLTIIFNIFVLMQLCNEFNARILDNSAFVLKNIQHAPMFLMVVGSTFVIQILGVQYGGALMRCVPLSKELWAKCAVFAVVPLPLGVLLRQLHISEAMPSPSPVVKDEKEELALCEARLQHRHPSMKRVAKQVIMRLRVIHALQPNAARPPAKAKSKD